MLEIQSRYKTVQKKYRAEKRKTALLECEMKNVKEQMFLSDTDSSIDEVILKVKSISKFVFFLYNYEKINFKLKCFLKKTSKETLVKKILLIKFKMSRPKL